MGTVINLALSKGYVNQDQVIDTIYDDNTGYFEPAEPDDYADNCLSFDIPLVIINALK